LYKHFCGKKIFPLYIYNCIASSVISVISDGISITGEEYETKILRPI
jgi:hypothetical protein